MSRHLHTVIVRIDALDEPIPGFDTEDYVEAYGPFLSRQSAVNFCAGLEEELAVRLDDGGFLPYGTITFHPCAMQWHTHPSNAEWNDEPYNIDRIVDNWVHAEEV